MAIFVIVGPGDIPIYRAELESRSIVASDAAQREGATIIELALHSALDRIDSDAWPQKEPTATSFLREITQVYGYWIHAYICAGGARFLICIDKRASSEGVGKFFVEVAELYARVAVNVFQPRDEAIFSPMFDSHVRACFKRHL